MKKKLIVTFIFMMILLIAFGVFPTKVEAIDADEQTATGTGEPVAVTDGQYVEGTGFSCLTWDADNGLPCMNKGVHQCRQCVYAEKEGCYTTQQYGVGGYDASATDKIFQLSAEGAASIWAATHTANGDATTADKQKIQDTVRGQYYYSYGSTAADQTSVTYVNSNRDQEKPKRCDCYSGWNTYF